MQEAMDWQVHADHCIELLRATAMCRADTTSLTTFVWERSEKLMLSNERVPKQCVDWDALVESTQYRIVSREEAGSMRNPRWHSNSDVQP